NKYANFDDRKSSKGLADFRTPSLTGIAEAKNAFLTEALRVSAGQQDNDQAAIRISAEELVAMMKTLLGVVTATTRSPQARSLIIGSAATPTGVIAGLAALAAKLNKAAPAGAG